MTTPRFVALALSTAIVSAQTPIQFEARTATALSTAGLGHAAVADFDGDGDLDLCGGASMFSPFRQIYMRNDGNEQWTNLALTLPITSDNTLTTVAFDYDNDGDMDLFLSKQGPNSRLWNNNGQGVFTDATSSLPPLVSNHLAAAAADFDGDGNVDVAMMQGYFGTTPDGLLVNQGGGTFSLLPLSLGPQTTSITTGDVDLDGDLDIVVGSYTGSRVYRNDGNFVFTNVSSTWLAGVPQQITLSVALGDLDGDGFPDLVCGSQSAPDLVLLHTGSNGFIVHTTLPTFSSGTKSISLFDCDEDGDLDIAQAIISTGIRLHTNDGNGNLSPANARLPVLGAFSPRAIAHDFDRDGDIEILVADDILIGGNNPMLINRHRDLVTGPCVAGQTWNVTVRSEPGYATLHHTCRLAIALSPLSQPLQVPSFGELFLDLDSGYVALEQIVFANAGETTFSINVPVLPSFIGSELHLQAVVEQARGPARFTAYRSVVVQ